MADNPGVHIVEIRAGNSQRPVLELRPGTPVQPMSVGRVGMWSVDAPDVLDVHAFLYFDGRSLFVQSADAGNPAKGNGQAIGTAWQQLEIPCTIEIGRARLVYRALDEVDGDSDEDKTIAQPIKLPEAPNAQFRPNAGMFSNRTQAPDSDATRLQPMNMTREPDPTLVNPLEGGTPMGGVPKARPAAGMPAWSTDIAPTSSPTVATAPPAPPPPATGYQAFGSVQVAVPPPANPMVQTLQAPMQSPLQQQQPMMYQMPPHMMPQQPTMPGGPAPNMMMPGPAAETGRVQQPGELQGFKKVVAEWNALPPLRKVIFGAMPGVALLVYFMLFDDEPQQQARQPRPHPSASASNRNATASGSASGSGTNAPITSMTSTVVGPTTTASTVIVVTTIVDAGAPTIAFSAPPPPKGQKTQERQAIDLVAQGQYAKAVDIYEQLAQQHPEQPAFKEAARLLRQRTNGN